MNTIQPTHWGHRSLVGLALLILVTLAAPVRVSAHGGDNGPLATNYHSEIVDPGADGLTWSARGGDGFVELDNDTGQEVVVFGYQAEPYLWFVPGDGVYRNTSSPATYLNEDRYGDVDMPAGTSASAEPDWEQVTAANTYAWHDHRAHWMSRIDPPAVAAEPGREHLVLDFAIPLRVGDTDVAVAGELRWLPDVAWWPPVAALSVAACLLVAVVGFTTRPAAGRWAPLARAGTGIVLVVVAANLLRVVDDLDRYPTSSERAVLIITALVTLGAVVALCTRAWKGHPAGFGALAVAAVMVMLIYGGEAGSELSAPQLDTSLPDWIRRWTIAASYAVVAPAFLAAGIGAWWHARTLRDASSVFALGTFSTCVDLQPPAGRSEAVSDPFGFSWTRRKNGDVIIEHHGRRAAVLRGRKAEDFVDDVAVGNDQDVMARATGNYKRGNERESRNHPRNR